MTISVSVVFPFSCVSLVSLFIITIEASDLKLSWVSSTCLPSPHIQKDKMNRLTVSLGNVKYSYPLAPVAPTESWNKTACVPRPRLRCASLRQWPVSLVSVDSLLGHPPPLTLRTIPKQRSCTVEIAANPALCTVGGRIVHVLSGSLEPSEEETGCSSSLLSHC